MTVAMKVFSMKIEGKSVNTTFSTAGYIPLSLAVFDFKIMELPEIFMNEQAGGESVQVGRESV